MNWIKYSIPCFLLGLIARDAIETEALRMGSPFGSEIIVSVAIIALCANFFAECIVHALETLKED